jgi:dephospho-CoA kinase
MNTDEAAMHEARVARRRAWIARVPALIAMEADYDVVAAIHCDRNERLNQLGGS